MGDHIADHEDGGAGDGFRGDRVRQGVERGEDPALGAQAGVLDDPTGWRGAAGFDQTARQVAATATPI